MYNLTKPRTVQPLIEVILLLTYLFRGWLVVIIMTFVAQRYGLSTELVWAGAISSLAIVMDCFFTVRQLWGFDHHPALRFTTIVFKSALILVAICYAATIWYKVGYWVYTGFGLFVAAVFAGDFFILRKTSKAH